jgi:phosphoribosylformylglycinamidine synthase subunit PurSL
LALRSLLEPRDQPDVSVIDLVFLDRPLPPDVHDALFGDPLLRARSDEAPPSTTFVDVAFHPGVTDRVATEIEQAAAALGAEVRAATGRRYVGSVDPAEVANPVVERWTVDEPIAPVFETVEPLPRPVEWVHLDDLAELNRTRGLSLDADQLDAIARWCRSANHRLTDVELETIAQTWSEHCAHTTFRAALDEDCGASAPSLLHRVRGATDDIAAPFVVSAFDGNAGIVRFTPESPLVAVKVETHNHPSAIEPFGGAGTGVGGVVRDILGVAARPVANVDVLFLDHPSSRTAEGVVAGIADYGNKIGVPTVGGAVVYDPAFTGLPLVFCGCIGVVPDDLAPDRLQGPHPRDRVVVIGGRTGRDGLRGATFSSATMDASTGEVFGASVQIGDPIVEKLVLDVIVDTDLVGTFSAITDCGAGGLSSAVGELADRVGADVALDALPLKYPGLAPWERWLSEAQERMVLAVPPAHLAAVRRVCARHGVELTDIGEFGTPGAVLVVRCSGSTVVELPTEFLHRGRPARTMPLVAPSPSPTERRALDGDPGAHLLALLAHPSIASKQEIVRRYDHEVQGATIVRPSTGRDDDGPSDGTVIALGTGRAGLAIGIGTNPWPGVHNPYAMGWACVDEAIRNVVAAGADPTKVALCDNVSWGDPRRPETLGALAAAIDGACDAARAFRAPFVSGKDSLNNEIVHPDGSRTACPPALVITAIAHVADVTATVTSDLLGPGDVLCLLGRTVDDELRGSHLDLVLGRDGGGAAPSPDPNAPERAQRLHRAIARGLVRSCHDVAEGGLAVALAEMAIGGRCGLDVPNPPNLFSESVGRYVIAVRADDLGDALDELGRRDVTVLGTSGAGGRVRIGAIDLALGELVDAFTGRVSTER